MAYQWSPGWSSRAALLNYQWLSFTGQYVHSLKRGNYLPPSEEATFDPADMSNLRHASNLPFHRKVIEWVVAAQLQRFLEDTDCLDPFEIWLQVWL